MSKRIELVGYGYNQHCDLGNSAAPTMYGYYEIDLPESVTGIKQLACGIAYSILLDENGNLYSWGKLASGVSGYPAHDTPTLITYFKNHNIKISSISCRNAHCGAISTEGKIFVWGDNRMGHIPGPEVIYEEEPLEIKIDSDSSPVQICCGGYFTIILLKNGEVYSFGFNQDNCLGQLALVNTCFPNPKKIDQFYFKNSPIIKIAAGWTHAAALSENYELFSWGRNESGRLGHNEGKHISHVMFNPKGKILEIGCGDTNLIEFDDCNEIRACGWNRKGECGVGDHKVRRTMRPMKEAEGVRPISLICGADDTLVITREGFVFATGNNDHNKIGIGGDMEYTNLLTKVPNLSCVVAGAAGYQHTILAMQY
ncbi:regulator of chromosome condensation (RCC1)-like protein [Histomonas meleagridis]|uniref:regulator of chromosome condensation (RCC1)-like protein n=1 Tax=Histomonas meleagridis TaxID=135588 RepID=UPI00355A9A91|nr:regulator of chromosome condensation (RCC1)-like protein [Histomonas meleagridis]KAH0797719.1 regulator of chromosome condensation (RCC1)-like protein [Histomonas meleagridis]